MANDEDGSLQFLDRETGTRVVRVPEALEHAEAEIARLKAELRRVRNGKTE